MKERTWRVGLALGASTAAALALWWSLSSRRAGESWRARHQVVLSLPFGRGLEAAGRSLGLDGLDYGPLAFAVHGNAVAVADTYQERVLWRERGRPVAFRSLGDALLDDVVWSAQDHGWLVADNHNLAVWLVGRAGVRRLVTLPEPAGTSRAIWHLWVDPRGDILVEVLTLGRGRVETEWNEYRPDGRAAAHPDPVLKVLAARGAPGAGDSAGLESVVLGPAGDVYGLETRGDARTRTVFRWRPDGTLVGRVSIPFPRPVRQAVLLGVSRDGTVYVGADLGSRNGVVEVVSPAGQVEHVVSVPPEPVRASVYGRATPDGTLYLVENTPSAYRLVRWWWQGSRAGRGARP